MSNWNVIKKTKLEYLPVINLFEKCWEYYFTQYDWWVSLATRKKGTVSLIGNVYNTQATAQKNLRGINWNKLVENKTKKYGKKQWNAEVISIEEWQRFKELWFCGLPNTQKK